jgi:cell division protein FtsI/penicillin-binding protein 2
MSEHRTRIRIISICTILFALLLVTKLYFVQIVAGQDFKDRADRQYLRPAGNVYDRGNIYFKTKDGTLMAAATLKTGYTIAINPKIIKDIEGIYTKINAIIPIDHDAFIQKASKANDSYEEIAVRIDDEKANTLDSLKILGVNIYKERWRYYPGDELASQVLGFVGYKGDDFSGRYGLENFYNTTLTRTNENVYVNLFAEIFSDIHKSLTDTGTAEGDIVTSIDPNVQNYLENQLKIVQSMYRSQISGGIVIDPNTGEIYAMGMSPTFNPNTFGNVSNNVSVFTNAMVQNVYEMGSIIKPLTMAAGLDSGVIDSSTTYNDKGCQTLNTSTFCNYDLRARGPGTPIQEILNQSLNMGAAFVESKVGNKQFADYMMNKFGLGEPTGIDLPNEGKAILSNLKSPRDIEYATASFGQGIAMSPIATARALSVLANGGKLVTPHIVTQVKYKVGFDRTVEYPAPKQVLKPGTSEQISKMLTKVVDTALLEGDVKMDHYTLAAKTGTAQISGPGGKYYSDRYLHSFFGYFPATKPRFLVFLYTFNPQGVEFASHTLTVPFINVTKFLINYYEIPPDR